VEQFRVGTGSVFSTAEAFFKLAVFSAVPTQFSKFALPVGDLRVSGHRRRTSAGQPVNRYVPLAEAVLAPVIVNILSFHATMAPSGLPQALFVAVLWALIFVDVRPAFTGLFQSRFEPRA